MDSYSDRIGIYTDKKLEDILKLDLCAKWEINFLALSKIR